MTQNSFYWHDYETFGVDPQRDRAVQFAGIRTDFDFNIIGEPLVIYCQPSDDTLPQPEACYVTGITPQIALQKGVCEAEFIALIHDQMIQPGTCTLGYNNLRFDDEVTRNLLYRNFYDPYEREWKNGNSRWDLIDLMRTVYALRPDGINWPVDADGKTSLRLENLTAANGIEHADAHDALSDVYATIALAKLLKQAQPRLFQFFLQHRGKQRIKQLLQLGSYTPVVHVSGMYGNDKYYIALVVPICAHPTNSNGVIVYDLSVNPDVMLGLSVADIQQRIFTPKDELADGVARIPLKTVHVNKCPIIAPANVLRESDAVRLGIDRQQCLYHRDLIQQADDIVTQLTAVFGVNGLGAETVTDPDLMIYSGGFFSADDRQQMNRIRHLSVDQLSSFKFKTQDARLAEMLFRYRARNFPDSLDAQERMQWQKFCFNRLSATGGNSILGFKAFYDNIAQLKMQDNAPGPLLDELQQYAATLKNRITV